MGVDIEMRVRLPYRVDDEMVAGVAYDMVEAFGPEHFWLHKDDDYESRALARDKEYAGPGDQLTVGLGGRYYGEGYERGDLPIILMVAEYLDRKFPAGTILYGGDSSDDWPPFDRSVREALWQHFVEVGHKPYNRSWDQADGIPTPRCDFCSRLMLRYGVGPTFGSFRCSGCGQGIATHDSGKTWTKEYEIGGQKVHVRA